MGLGGFALHHEYVTAASFDPSRWLYVLHGIFGRSANWRTFARKLTRARPEWGVVLVDLREHGRSLGASPPHTLAACADDLRALADILTLDGKPVSVVVGHSFGGKVALEYRRSAGDDLDQTWVLDASPTANPNAIYEGRDTVRVLQALEALPDAFATREAFVSALTEQGQRTGQGFTDALGRWLAMNLTPVDGGGYRFGLDLQSVRELLTNYFDQDLWDAVDSPGLPGQLFVVIAGRSEAISAADRDQLTAIAGRSEGAVHVHTFPRAGHWVHVDALDELVSLVSESLPA